MSRIVPCPHCGQLNRLQDDRKAAAARCPSCHSPLFTGRPVALDTGNFDRQIKSADLPVVVDFWAAWCGPCRAMAPVFDAVAAEMEPALRFAKLDTEAAPEIADRYGIRSIPTLVIFRGGKEIARQSGALGASDLKRFIAASLATA